MTKDAAAMARVAHDAWFETSRQWRLRKVDNYGLSTDVWLLENVPSPGFDPNHDYANDIAYHKFDGANAEKRARLMLRDKIVQAVVAAILKKQESP